jgi:hypothetical protein
MGAHRHRAIALAPLCRISLADRSSLPLSKRDARIRTTIHHRLRIARRDAGRGLAVEPFGAARILFAPASAAVRKPRRVGRAGEVDDGALRWALADVLPLVNLRCRIADARFLGAGNDAATVSSGAATRVAAVPRRKRRTSWIITTAVVAPGASRVVDWLPAPAVTDEVALYRSFAAEAASTHVGAAYAAKRWRRASGERAVDRTVHLAAAASRACTPASSRRASCPSGRSPVGRVRRRAATARRDGCNRGGHHQRER